MIQKRGWYIAANILPIVVSGVIYMIISAIDYHLWLYYDALVVPIYLLLANFILRRRFITCKSLMVMLCIVAVCFFIHVLYFSFNFGIISSLALLLYAGVSVVIIVTGSLIYNFFRLGHEKNKQ